MLRSSWNLRRCTVTKCAVFLCAAALSIPAATGQTSTPSKPTSPFAEEFAKYPGLQEELGKLAGRLQKEIQLPPLRSQSSLLPLLPASTLYYAAFPNSGEVLHQISNIFNDELRQSAPLRDWWQHGPLATNGPVIQSYLDKIYQLSEYLGDEIVVFGGTEAGDHSPVVLARIRKPGLENFVRQTLTQLPGNPKISLRVLTPRELASVANEPTGQQLLVVVDRDFALVGENAETLRSVSSLLESDEKQFATNPFGQRLLKTYQGGALVVAGADVHKFLAQLPPGPGQSQQMLVSSGFADMKYLVWKSNKPSEQIVSEAELSFNGPRHGIASWLARPVALNSLDFVSPDALFAVTAKLKNFAEIFDDVKELALSVNPAGWNQFEQMQQAMGLDLREDLLSHLDGEITLELDGFTPPEPPAWRAIVSVNHPEAFQQTFDRLLQSSPFPSDKSEENGTVYHTLHIPSGQKEVDATYAYADGYMIVAPSHKAAASALRLHSSGQSLAKSEKFWDVVPDHSLRASGILYENPLAFAAQAVQHSSPDVAQTISQLTAYSKPILVRGYGEESAIREVSESSGAGMNPATILIVAAVAIPNLLRARIAANESSAVASLRTTVTAQVMYSTQYPQKGYAADLASLGPDPRGPSFQSSRHAGIIDATLGNVTCTAAAWCAKYGFRFTLKSTCGTTQCREFVAIATPESDTSGTRNFCVTSDGVVRYQVAPRLTAPVSASQCRSWLPLQQ
ncbi:MAG TPA: hypothetical protein VJO35_02910 [Terriglobales bacterium]|nr:hypothetical protein [Terriglobales bacterium]